MIWQPVFDYLQRSGMDHWAAQLQRDSKDWLIHHGDFVRWSAAFESLPQITQARLDCRSPAVTIEGNCEQPEQLLESLQGLMPWRKGPYKLGGIEIDCEWRSDYKWDRVLPHLEPLQQRRILDIGCGNGYHCWRMLAESPAFVLGIEPSVLFNLQFQAIQKYSQNDKIGLLPIGVEALPEKLEWFDTVFSMGVLYHRRSPIDHIYQLRDCLVDGGELCLETLVVEGEAGRVLMPAGRYARMRNVWFIPSAIELSNWLRRCGFERVRIVDESPTLVSEQRSTDWMQFESLQHCLHPDNPELTVEGLPAPRRAVILARKSAN